VEETRVEHRCIFKERGVNGDDQIEIPGAGYHMVKGGGGRRDLTPSLRYGVRNTRETQKKKEGEIWRRERGPRPQLSTRGRERE
jgi:hypothetical protein